MPANRYSPRAPRFSKCWRNKGESQRNVSEHLGRGAGAVATLAVVFHVGEHEAATHKQESRVPHGSLDAPTRDASSRAPGKVPREQGTGQTFGESKKEENTVLES